MEDLSTESPDNADTGGNSGLTRTTQLITAICTPLGVLITAIGLILGIYWHRNKKSKGSQCPSQGNPSAQDTPIESGRAMSAVVGSSEVDGEVTAQIETAHQNPQQELPLELRVEEAGSSPEDMDTQDAPITTSGNVNFPQEAGYMSDIYLVSSSKNTPYVEKMMRIIKDNNWTLTTSFTGRLGELKMQSAEEAVKNCLYIVLIITKEDCEKMNGKYNMIIEMAFKSMEKSNLQGRVIPILCCSEESLPLRLGSLTAAGIDDVNLEERLKDAVGITIKERREAQGCLVSAAESASLNPVDQPSLQTRNTVLTDKHFMDLAKQIGAEWEQLGLELGFTKSEIECIVEEKRKVVYRTLYILQTWKLRTSLKTDREKVDVLCKALIECDRVDLSEIVRSDSGYVTAL